MIKRAQTIRKSSNSTIPTDILYKGWLKKQGGKFRTMKRRYFALSNEVLYYFTGLNMNTQKGQISIKQLELSDICTDSNNDFVFYLLPEKGKETITDNHTKYMFATNEKVEAANWVFYLKQALYLKLGGGLFGVSLNIVAPYLRAEYEFVPRVVYEICSRLRQIGFDEEGIFRKNGQKSEINRLKNLADKADYDWFSSASASQNDSTNANETEEEKEKEKETEKEEIFSNDVHNLCSLLKLYLRELPEPLIPFGDYDDMKAVGYRIEADENIELVSERLEKLPPANLHLLHYLCKFLAEVSENPNNLMTVSNLATVMAPNILRDQETDPYIEETTSSLISTTVGGFINRYKDLFNFEIKLPNSNGTNKSDLSKSSTLTEAGCDNESNDSDTYSLTSAISTANITDFSSSYNESSINNIDTCAVSARWHQLNNDPNTTPVSTKKSPNISSYNNNEPANCTNCAKLENELSQQKEELKKIETECQNLRKQVEDQIRERMKLEDELREMKAKSSFCQPIMDTGDTSDWSDLLRRFNCEPKEPQRFSSI